MGGFKEGTVDGWDDDQADDHEQEFETTDSTKTGTSTDEARTTDLVNETETRSSATDSGNDTERRDIPWILRRNSITDGRKQTVQLHLQEETLNIQRTQKSIIESRLGDSVRKADLREAALLVGLQYTDDVAEVLKEWGYALE